MRNNEYAKTRTKIPLSLIRIRITYPITPCLVHIHGQLFGNTLLVTQIKEGKSVFVKQTHVSLK